MKGEKVIIFKSDWDKYPNAIMDINTKNRSFYKQAIKYKLMGVENHGFLLSLLDRSLQGVDPFDEENLTRDQKDRIIVEIKRNPWYFFREIIRVSLTGGGVGYLEANRANIALIFMFLCHIFTILIQIRQSGKSLNTDALKTYALLFAVMNTTITFLTNNDRNRTESIERIRGFEKTLPNYLRVITANDINNQTKIHIRATDNKYATAVAQAVRENAKMVHRGNTSPIQHIDESAYIYHLKESLSSMLKAGNAARDQAAKAGSLYGTILSTTAGYKDTPHGNYMYKIYKSGAIFTEKMFDAKDQEDLERLIKTLSPDNLLRVTIEMNHRQLGKTDNWLAGKIEDTASEGNDTLTDFFNVWVTDRGKALLTADDRKKISESKLENYTPEISEIEGYTMRWYISEAERQKLIDDGESIIGGLDSSEAIGKDDITLVLTRVTTGEVIAAADFNETNIIIFGTYIADLLLKYNKLVLNPEKRSTGSSIVDTIIPILLEKGINPLTRVFNWIVNDMNSDPKMANIYTELMNAYRVKDRRVFDKYKKYFGFSTSGSGRTSRTKLYSNTFNAAVKYTGSTMRDPKLIRQINGLKEINGRVDHDADDHDDMVIAWLLAFWVLKEGKNLSTYGIDINSVLLNIKETIYKNGVEDVDKMKKLKHHNQAMANIKTLSDRIAISNNPIEINQCKLMMKKFSGFLDYSITPSFNIDVHIAKIENEAKLQKKVS